MPVTIALTPSANLTVNRLLDTYGGSKSKLVETVMQWFADAPQSVQQVIRGGVPSDMHDDYLRKLTAYFTGLIEAAAPGAGQKPPIVALTTTQGQTSQQVDPASNSEGGGAGPAGSPGMAKPPSPRAKRH